MENLNNQYQTPQNRYLNLSVGEWVLTLFLTSIPIIGLIMLCIWAFGDCDDDRKNYAKASLLWRIIFYAILFAYIGCVGVALVACS